MSSVRLAAGSHWAESNATMKHIGEQYGTMRFYTTEEVAEIFKMHPKTIRRMCKNGEIRAMKLGGEYRISEEDLKKCIDEHTSAEGSP